MQFFPLQPDGLLIVQLDVYHDARGFFVERFARQSFESGGLPGRFAQLNHSRSLPRVLRGLHFQEGQGKLVSVVRGSILDVAVDIRPDSRTFGQSRSVELTDANGIALWIPAGFAHGFCVLGHEPADVIYCVDVPYDRQREGGIHWADPDLAIDWRIEDPQVSERDRNLPSFAAFCEASDHDRMRR
jgi:dTDP-4-dehydrorhamnose 3,5-epimerase